MKRLTKAVVLSAAVVLAGQAARAQIATGDLVLGFTSPTATEDYVVDLGQPAASTSLGSLINLSQFNSAFSGGIASVASIGVIGGLNGAAPGDFVDFSVLRTGNNAAGTQGTEAAPTKPSSGGNVTAAATAAISTTLGTPANSAQFSFTGNSTVTLAGSFANNLNQSPLVATGGASTIALDIFQSFRLPKSGLSTPASTFSYFGTLDIDFSGSTPQISFIPVTAVPEPASYGLLAGAGLLIMSLRRQLGRSNA